MDFLKNYFAWENAIEKLRNDRRTQVDRRLSNPRHLSVYSRKVERRGMSEQRRNWRRVSRWGSAHASLR